MPKIMKLRFDIEVIREDGPVQDEDEVITILTENIESIGDFYVQDSDHEKESQYRIGEVIHLRADE